jgi:hypothetical protein
MPTPLDPETLTVGSGAGVVGALADAARFLETARTQLLKTPGGQESMSVHSGFLAAYYSVKPRLMDLLDGLLDAGDYTVLVTGHSLGGALATLFSFEVRGGAVAMSGSWRSCFLLSLTFIPWPRQLCVTSAVFLLSSSPLPGRQPSVPEQAPPPDHPHVHLRVPPRGQRRVLAPLQGAGPRLIPRAQPRRYHPHGAQAPGEEGRVLSAYPHKYPLTASACSDLMIHMFWLPFLFRVFESYKS